MSDNEKENTEDTYPLKDDGKAYIQKGADKHKNLENKTLED